MVLYNWTETPECPGGRGDYVSESICQQFCDRTGASMPGYASNIAAGRAAAAEEMPAR